MYNSSIPTASRARPTGTSQPTPQAGATGEAAPTFIRTQSSSGAATNIVDFDLNNAQMVDAVSALALSLDVRHIPPERRAGSSFLTLPPTFGPAMVRQMATLPSVVAVDSEARPVGFMLASEPDPATPSPVVQGLLAAFARSPHAQRSVALYGPIGVAASQQGKGLAPRMFESLVERVRSTGKEALLGFVDASNGPSMGLHLKKLGFEDVGRFQVGAQTYVAIMAELTK